MENYPDSGYAYVIGDESPDMALPIAIQRWLGLRTNSGSYGITSLSSHNDTGKTFNEIADIIEGGPLDLLK